MAKGKANATATREQQIASEVARLRGMRGRSRQQETELDWLLTLQQKDALQAQIDSGGQELADLRAKHRQARDRLQALEDARQDLAEIPAGQLVEVVKGQEAAFTEAGAMVVVVQELGRRLREAEAAQRARSNEHKRLTSLAMDLKARAGLPGSF